MHLLTKFVCGFILLIFYSCASSSSSEYRDSNVKNSDFNKSFFERFKYDSLQEVSAITLAKERHGGEWLLKKVDPIEYNKFLPPNLLNEFQTKSSELFLYGYKKLNSSQIAFVEIVQAQEYVGSILVTMNLNELEIIDYLEIEGGSCPGPYLDEDENVVWCEKKSGHFFDDDKLRVVRVKYNSDDFLSGSVMRIDSIKVDYKFTENGQISQVSKDSVRFISTVD